MPDQEERTGAPLPEDRMASGQQMEHGISRPEPDTLQASEPDALQSLEQESPADLAVVAAGEPDNFCPIAPEDAPAAIEALLFASGDPLTLEQLARILVIDRERLRRILDDMIERTLRDRSRGVMLREADGSFTLATKPVQKDVLGRLFSPRHRPPLSPAAYETLAIIAYNQPVTRAQIEAVRGVNSDNVLQRLIERSLVREAGTLDAPGRPSLFAITDHFLLDFGLRSVAELPPMEMLMYGTLRDIEQALETAANHRPDKQVTIEQLVSAIVPVPEGRTAAGPVSEEPLDPAAEAEVLGMSAALFGVPPAESESFS